jgi:hypothetical protein
VVQSSDKVGADFRAKGRLEYVDKHHLRFAGTNEDFLKAGPDAPETLLGYLDFDGTETFKTALKSWAPHVQDWNEGDPTWQDGKGKGLIGALNYLSSKGCNAFSFLTYNAGGDGDNVWPFISRDAKRHYDCSKLDQWQIIFAHAQAKGLYLHFKMQEQEMDDNRRGHNAEAGAVPTSLNDGDLGLERKLYCRELIARFGHFLALNWNLGEENTQSPKQQRDMARYLKDTDPYDNHVVVHTFPDQQDKVYSKLVGDQSVLTGASLQNDWSQVHQRTLQWITESAKAKRPWVVANDEQGPASHGAPQDPGFEGTDGKAKDKKRAYDLHDIRKNTLWGNLMAGGAGVEYYFGYKLPQNDLICENFRSRDQSWDYYNIALTFFQTEVIPFWDMANANALVGNQKNDNSRYCLAKAGEVYLVYLPSGGNVELDLSGTKNHFSVRWLNPRVGGNLESGSVTQVTGGGAVSLGTPPTKDSNDWLAVVRKASGG